MTCNTSRCTRSRRIVDELTRIAHAHTVRFGECSDHVLRHLLWLQFGHSFTYIVASATLNRGISPVVKQRGKSFRYDAGWAVETVGPEIAPHGEDLILQTLVPEFDVDLSDVGIQSRTPEQGGRIGRRHTVHLREKKNRVLQHGFGGELNPAHGISLPPCGLKICPWSPVI